MRNQQKQSRGFGFCVFQEKESFDNVLKKKYHIIDNRSVYNIMKFISCR